MKNEIVDTDLNTSLKNSKRILSLPYPKLKEKEIEYVCDNIRNFYQVY